MEDGYISDTKVQASLSTSIVLPTMANYPDIEVSVIKNKANTTATSDNSIKVNGESEPVLQSDDEYTSDDEDTLIIDEENKRDDETPKSNRKRGRSPSPRANFKGFKKRIIAKSIHILQITNELRNVSFYIDLSFGKDNEKLNATATPGSTPHEKQHSPHENVSVPDNGESNCILSKPNATKIKPATANLNNTLHRPSRRCVTNKKRPSQKLTEYAQYLGLQPAVKFKCVKCSESNFQTMSALNDHQRLCLSQPVSQHTKSPLVPVSSGCSTSTNFRVTRKVFLCSSCGTYYENCNLFLHMREVHRRYICLYCLGMFSLPEKLSHHLTTKHNCSPKHYASADEFLKSYTESCYLICCHCERVFSERDNFFEHTCVEKRTALPEKGCWSCGIKPPATHLLNCKATEVQSTSTTPAPKSTNKFSKSKQNKSKSSQKGGSNIAPVEHVTADSSMEPEIQTESEPSTVNAAEHFMAITETLTQNSVTNCPSNDPNNIQLDPTLPKNTQLLESECRQIKTEIIDSPSNDNKLINDKLSSEEIQLIPNVNKLILNTKLQTETYDEVKFNSEINSDQEVGAETKNSAETKITDTCHVNILQSSDNTNQNKSDTELNTSSINVRKHTAEREDSNKTDDEENKHKSDGEHCKDSDDTSRETSDNCYKANETQNTNGDNRNVDDRNSEDNKRNSENDNSNLEHDNCSTKRANCTNDCLDTNTDQVDNESDDNTENTDYKEDRTNRNIKDENNCNKNCRESNKASGDDSSSEDCYKETEDDNKSLNKNKSTDKDTRRNINSDGKRYTKEQENCDKDSDDSDNENHNKDNVEQNNDNVDETKGCTDLTEDQTTHTYNLNLRKDSTDSDKDNSDRSKNNSNPNQDTSELNEDNLDQNEEDNSNMNKSNESSDANKDAENSPMSEDQNHDSSNDEAEDTTIQQQIPETRKVPKVTLKLPPSSMVYSEAESDDSEKLTMEIEDNSDNSNPPVNGFDDKEDDEYCPAAGEDVPIIELELDQPLDKFHVGNLIRTCLSSTISSCVYCNHARKIAVNGKQLGLHAISEHRFAATVNSITAEELIPASFVTRIKEGLTDVEDVFFNLEAKEEAELITDNDDSSVGNFKRIYECFQCRYVTTIHKELYLHNRKMHAKTILLCIMCKSNFYSYSELICHLCPGNYVLHSETSFRCCICTSNDLPSAFRLMVHLRKRHHTCDVCLEFCQNQSKLSNHVWKHKLHHLCYRCGIAYRNKPDITKHLFWKHGTESVLCKKCLQKKWPHVYHFCIPPVSFVCEECSSSFSKAVYLKVHKRLHVNEKPHACTEDNCKEMFISKKLQLKHELRHREPLPIEVAAVLEDKQDDSVETKNEVVKTEDESSKVESNEKAEDGVDKDEPKKNLIDVYDLPALNLSESDSDDSEEEKLKTTVQEGETEPVKLTGDEKKNVDINLLDDDHKPVPILDGIWDNFKNYQATIEKRDDVTDEILDDNQMEPILDEDEIKPDLNDILADHDYCIPQETSSAETEPGAIKTETNTGLDHDYCTVTQLNPSEATTKSIADNPEKKKSKTSKKKSTKRAGSSSSSDSSSDSGSSSCTCGSNCSCSSSSGSSSSSSTSSDSDTSSSEGKRRIQARRDRRKERAKRKKESETSHTSAVDVVATEDIVPLLPVLDLPIEESDLDTDETETDEDFYDEYPQRLANKILAEKRNQLVLAAVAPPISNGAVLEPSLPSTPIVVEPEPVIKKRVKSKKRKKKNRQTPKLHIPEYNIVQTKPQSPIPIIIPAPALHTTPTIPVSKHIISTVRIANEIPLKQKLKHSHMHHPGSGSETDSNVRSSKRRRVPNKFYGYSSDEDREKHGTIPTLKFKKSDLNLTLTTHHHVTGSSQFVPPITIKSIMPSPAPVSEPPMRAPIVQVVDTESDDDEEEEEEEEEEVAAAPVATATTTTEVLPREVVENSESSESESNSDDGQQLHMSSQHQPVAIPPVKATLRPPPATAAILPPHHHNHHHHQTGMPRTNENLYCYCQCPYDEVSEMIACDGKDCAIEWFHFECVGIMVPPKGKWFCPDCRKKTLVVQT